MTSKYYILRSPVKKRKWELLTSSGKIVSFKSDTAADTEVAKQQGYDYRYGRHNVYMTVQLVTLYDRIQRI